jgi:hypothetical protein
METLWLLWNENYTYGREQMQFIIQNFNNILYLFSSRKLES